MQNISLNYDMIADIVIVEPLCGVQHRDLKKKKMSAIERCPLHGYFAQIGTLTSNTSS